MTDTEYYTKNAAWRRVVRDLATFAEKVAPIYAANNWTWIHPGGDERPPTAQEIHSLAYSLLWEARQSECGVSSGRLLARFVCHEGRWIASVALVPKEIRS